MELIEVIKSSLMIFFSFVSIAVVFSYITFKIKDRSKIRIEKRLVQVENVPVGGVYPRMLSVGDAYKVPKLVAEKVMPQRKSIFRHYSFNLNEKMHKLTLSR